MQLTKNRPLQDLESKFRKQQVKTAPLKTTEGTISQLRYYGKGHSNPVCCDLRTYKLYIATSQHGRIHVGYYCRVCHAMLKNGEEKQQT